MTAESDRPRVLIVDDEERVAETYALRLGEKYDTEIALGGDEALEVVDDTFDVVLLDRRMPDESGDVVLNEIRRRGLDCRVIMLTAVDPGFDITEMEFDDYIVKPIDKDELHDIVDRALTLSEYNEQLQQLSSLKLKRNVLEVEMVDHELEESEQYQQLLRDIAALERDIDEMEEGLDVDEVDLYL